MTMIANEHVTTPLSCVRCGQGITARRVNTPWGSSAYAGRRLCARCYQHCRYKGTLADWPRMNRQRAELLEDYAVLYEAGLTRDVIAERLGMVRTSLERALMRARRDGCEVQLAALPRR